MKTPPRSWTGFTVAHASTSAGLALGICGLRDANPWLLMASLACDVLDGFLARSLQGASSYGNRLDWLTDVVLANLALWRLGVPWLCPVVIGVQAWNDDLGRRVSLRAAIFVVLAVVGPCG